MRRFSRPLGSLLRLQTVDKQKARNAILYAAFVGNWLRERIHFLERRRGGGFLLSYAKMNRRCIREFLPCICKRVFIRCTVNNLTHIHTHTHSMYTRYRYQLLLLLLLYSTATIITIIGCLSIRLTPSSGPNYYVTIFIDNKGRNKHWSKIIVIKKKKNEKKTKWLLHRYSYHNLALPWLNFRVSSYSGTGYNNGVRVSFSSRRRTLTIDFNNRFIISFRRKDKTKKMKKVGTLPSFIKQHFSGIQ